jgi:hypothetical protein
MCLYEVTEENVELRSKKVVYKLFIKEEDGTLRFRYIGNHEIRTNNWIHESNHRNLFCEDVTNLFDTYSKKYPVGFHCYTSLKEAKKDRDFDNELVTFSNGERLVIRKCYVKGTVTIGVHCGCEAIVSYVKGTVTTGVQCGCEAIVSKELFITDEED